MNIILKPIFIFSNRYPDYKFYFNNTFTSINKIYSLRASTIGFESFLHDVYFLSNADHIVCTFTSNVCRVAYELLIPKSSDTYKLVRSLDIHYMNFEFYTYKRIAVLDHDDSHFVFKKGTLLYKEVYYSAKYDGYNHNGFYNLKLLNNGRLGTVASYKTKDIYW